MSDIVGPVVIISIVYTVPYLGPDQLHMAIVYTVPYLGSDQLHMAIAGPRLLHQSTFGLELDKLHWGKTAQPKISSKVFSSISHFCPDHRIGKLVTKK